MNKAAFTDEELTRAARLLQSAMLSSLPEDIPHEFSLEFHRKMAALRRRMKRRHGLKTAAKSVAAIIIALLIGGSALLTFDADTRAAFFNWVREVYESSAFYRFVGDEQAEALPYIRPTWLPEGYVEVDAVGNERQQTVVYQNEDNKDELILFYYCSIKDDRNISFYSKAEFEHKQTRVYAYAADLYIPYDTTETKELVWMDDKNGIIYAISSYGESSVILRIAKSVYWEE